MLTEFRNEPFTDFSKPENKAAYEAALAKATNEIGRRRKLFIRTVVVSAQNFVPVLENYDSGLRRMKFASRHFLRPPRRYGKSAIGIRYGFLNG